MLSAFREFRSTTVRVQDQESESLFGWGFSTPMSSKKPVLGGGEEWVQWAEVSCRTPASLVVPSVRLKTDLWAGVVVGSAAAGPRNHPGDLPEAPERRRPPLSPLPREPTPSPPLSL